MGWPSTTWPSIPPMIFSPPASRRESPKGRRPPDSPGFSFPPGKPVLTFSSRWFFSTQLKCAQVKLDRFPKIFGAKIKNRWKPPPRTSFWGCGFVEELGQPAWFLMGEDFLDGFFPDTSGVIILPTQTCILREMGPSKLPYTCWLFDPPIWVPFK